MGHYKVRKLKVQSIKNLINKKIGKPKPAKLEAAGKVERQKKGCFSLRSYLLYPAMVQNYYDTGLVAYTIR